MFRTRSTHGQKRIQPLLCCTQQERFFCSPGRVDSLSFLAVRIFVPGFPYRPPCPPSQDNENHPQKRWYGAMTCRFGVNRANCDDGNKFGKNCQCCKNCFHFGNGPLCLWVMNSRHRLETRGIGGVLQDTRIARKINSLEEMFPVRKQLGAALEFDR